MLVVVRCDVGVNGVPRRPNRLLQCISCRLDEPQFRHRHGHGVIRECRPCRVSCDEDVTKRDPHRVPLPELGWMDEEEAAEKVQVSVLLMFENTLCKGPMVEAVEWVTLPTC